ncbi:hypothetical protein [Methylomonas sp. MgM2]
MLTSASPDANGKGMYEPMAAGIAGMGIAYPLTRPYVSSDDAYAAHLSYAAERSECRIRCNNPDGRRLFGRHDESRHFRNEGCSR